MSEGPYIEEIKSPLAPAEALAKFHDWPRAVLFHSAAERAELGRYSFLSADPIETWDRTLGELIGGSVGSSPSATTRAFEPLRAGLQSLGGTPLPDLPPFQGGLAGLIGYELGGLFERLPSAGSERTPALSVGLYDWVIAWDHLQSRAWLIVQPAAGRRKLSTTARAAAIREVLGRNSRPSAARSSPGSKGSDPFARIPGLASNFNRQSYEQAVARIVRYIHAGDIFQANLSQRFTAPAVIPPVELYQRLARVNPAPFAGYYDGGSFQVISASPERFLRLSGDEVETRPIKGTRPRRPGVEADLLTRDELRESEKDRAENVMIVDLLRNDLSRVCRPGSIRVPQLCAVETYETVQHLVSVVRGLLNPDRDFFDLLAATFPGGSITGAPKIRAMEIITELEQVPRGPYCGSLFYLGANGEADSSILIRTFTQTGGQLSFPAGGGITAQSNPADEYAETLHKVEGLLRALE